MPRHAVLCLMLFASLHTFAAGSERPEAQEPLWAALKSGGYIIFIRHAVTGPGIGDPAHFKLGDCSTQRNLSDQGRADARRIGAAFRRNQIPVSEVLSSRWCRCLETAQLAFGSVRPAAMLDSMFVEDAAVKQRKVHSVLSFVSAVVLDTHNLVFVTHAQNIQELTGVSPSSGEIVVTKLDDVSKFQVVGRLPVPGE